MLYKYPPLVRYFYNEDIITYTETNICLNLSIIQFSFGFKIVCIFQEKERKRQEAQIAKEQVTFFFIFVFISAENSPPTLSFWMNVCVRV